MSNLIWLHWVASIGEHFNSLIRSPKGPNKEGTHSARMPNRARRKSVVDLLAKVPVHRGSLLKSIDDLLRTIDMSESAVMIPTLLRDKCQFDAWELLLVAKILKASILGHSDLVEFYLNHIGNQASNQAHNQVQHQLLQQQHLHYQNHIDQKQQNGASQLTPTTQSPGAMSAEMGLNSMDGSLNPSSLMMSFHSLNGNPASQSSGPLSWASANNGNGHPNGTSNGSANGTANNKQVEFVTSTSVFSVASNGSSSSNLTMNTANADSANQIGDSQTNYNNDDQESLLAIQMSREILSRPSRYVSNLGNSSPVATTQPMSPMGYNIEQLTSRLESMQTQAAPHPPESLSVSTTPTPIAAVETTLRTSRSVGCLSRVQSGSSSPRTVSNSALQPNSTAPTTPLAIPYNQFISTNEGDRASEPVKLLFQIEQLKTSINHVKNLLESVVELYKKSIDNISLA